MPRPKLCRRINFKHDATIFKAKGCKLCNSEIIEITHEELEAMRLKNLEELDQMSCASKMNTSQSTCQRILTSAYKKITDALVNGKSIKISK